MTAQEFLNKYHGITIDKNDSILLSELNRIDNIQEDYSDYIFYEDYHTFIQTEPGAIILQQIEDREWYEYGDADEESFLNMIEFIKEFRTDHTSSFDKEYEYDSYIYQINNYIYEVSQVSPRNNLFGDYEINEHIAVKIIK
jgi:hypothetical protein